MFIASIFFFFILGLIVGSFGNVLIYRIPKGESIVFPGSHCPSCGHELSALENIPVVSYIFLRGKCKGCAQEISLRYPLVELASGFLYITALFVSNNYVQALFTATLLYILLILSIIDIDTHRLPNPLVLSFGIIGLLGVAASYFNIPEALYYKSVLSFENISFPVLPHLMINPENSALIEAFFGSIYGIAPAALAAIFYYLVRKKSGFGMGDLKLLAVLGPFLGVYTLGVLPIASMIALLAIFALRLRDNNISLKRQIPFGPFIATATLAILIVGEPIWNWYMGLILMY